MTDGNVDSVKNVLLYQNDIDYIKKYSDDGTYTYVGVAVPGTATSSALWQIKRLDNSSGDVVWAGEASTFVNIWDDRTSLSYG